MTSSRRLAAILVADVVGYSRLVETDEAGTIAALKERQRDILEPSLKEHGGRLVKTMGDGVLVEFSSAVNAVKGALDLLDRYAAANEGVANAGRILLRIGINLGDVIEEDGDILGEGVNVAARLEALAEPGGMCISAKVQAEVEGRIALGFTDLGEQRLKNMAVPVRVFRAHATSGQAVGPHATSRLQPNLLLQSGWVDPDKQSIAVLPFLNLSGDADQEYFSDGLTEDIITELSRFKSLFVISRHASFQIKGRVANAREVGRQLTAKFVVEGSVRRAGGRVRISAQLIETASDRQLWGERYDRELKDIFEVQDDVVRAIASVIPGEVDRWEIEKTRQQPTSNLTAYDFELRGRWGFYHSTYGVANAIGWYERAIEADPNYAVALAGLAQATAYGVFMLGSPAAESFARAGELATRAVSLDDRNPEILRCAAYVSLLRGDNDVASARIERAAMLNPNDHLIMQTMGEVLAYGGRLREAVDWLAKSAKLVPYSPDDRRLDLLCEAYYMLGDYEKVIHLTKAYEDIQNYGPIAAACAQLGDLAGAEKARTKLLSFFTAEDTTKMLAAHLQMCARPDDREHWIRGYRLAGLPV